MKTTITVAIVAALSSPAWAGGGAPTRPIADQLDAAAARAALAELSRLKGSDLDPSGAGYTLQAAVAELGRAGDLDDLRALVQGADASKPQLTSFFLEAYARLGDRAEVDKRV